MWPVNKRAAWQVVGIVLEVQPRLIHTHMKLSFGSALRRLSTTVEPDSEQLAKNLAQGSVTLKCQGLFLK